MQEFALKSEMMVGRADESDIQVLEKLASRQHAKITCRDYRVTIEDLGSSNGTKVNGNKIQQANLRFGDIIAIGDTTIRYVDHDLDPLVGKTVGNYKIIEMIGRGGMGSVYEARQYKLDRHVALKILNQDLSNDRKFIQDFINEAKTAASLNHPNIISIYDAGDIDGRYFFSMEFVAGCMDIQKLVEKQDKLEYETALRIADEVAAALSYAHEKGIIHRDIKPQNIMLENGFKAKLADMGLAKPLEKLRESSSHDSVVGTPFYMSPEQARQVEIDVRSDIYSLGGTLYYMLTGQVPFDGKTPLAVITKHISEAPRPPVEIVKTIPRKVSDLTLRMLEKDPGKRFQTAEGVRKKITDILKNPDGGSDSRRISSTQLKTRKPSFSPISGIIILLIAIVGYLIISSFTQEGHDGPVMKMTRVEAEQNLLKAFELLNDGKFQRAKAYCEDVIRKCPETPYETQARERIAQIRIKKNALRADQSARMYSNAIDMLLRRDEFPEFEKHAKETFSAIIQKYPETKAAAMARNKLDSIAREPEVPDQPETKDVGDTKKVEYEKFTTDFSDISTDFTVWRVRSGEWKIGDSSLNLRSPGDALIYLHAPVLQTEDLFISIQIKVNSPEPILTLSVNSGELSSTGISFSQGDAVTYSGISGDSVSEKHDFQWRKNVYNNIILTFSNGTFETRINGMKTGSIKADLLRKYTGRLTIKSSGTVVSVNSVKIRYVALEESE